MAWDRIVAEATIRALYLEIATTLLSVVPDLVIRWRGDENDCGTAGFASTEDGPEIRLTLGRAAGIVRIASAIVHECTHHQGYNDHRGPFRRAFVHNVRRLWGIDATDAATVPYRYDLDLVIEYRLWQSRVLVPHVATRVLGNPDISVPSFRIEVVSPLLSAIHRTAAEQGWFAVAAYFRRWKGKIRVTAESGWVLGNALLTASHLFPQQHRAALDRLVTTLRTLPREGKAKALTMGGTDA